MGASLTKEDYRAVVEHVTCDVECEPLLPPKKCDFECILCYDYTDRVIEPSVYIDNQTWAKPTTARCKKITTAIFSKKAVVLQRKPKTH